MSDDTFRTVGSDNVFKASDIVKVPDTGEFAWVTGFDEEGNPIIKDKFGRSYEMVESDDFVDDDGQKWRAGTMRSVQP